VVELRTGKFAGQKLDILATAVPCKPYRLVLTSLLFLSPMLTTEHARAVGPVHRVGSLNDIIRMLLA